MIFKSFFTQLPKHAYKNLLILLSCVFILSSFFSIMAYNEKFKTLDDYKIINGTVTDYYSSSLKKIEGKGWNKYLVIIIDDSIRIGLVKSRYKKYIDSLNNHIMRGMEAKFYVEENDKETYKDETYTYNSNERPEYANYYMFPEQVELKHVRYIPKSALNNEQPNLTEEELTIMMVNGDSSALAQTDIVENIEVVIPESYDTTHNIITGTMILPISAIAFFFIIITLLHYFKMTPRNFDDLDREWKEDLAKREKEKEAYEATLITPNHIPFGKRIKYSILSLGLLIYGTLGLIIDDLNLPGKRGSGVHFHGVSAWVLYAAFLCAIANMVSIVVDHYDKRNNERNYRMFARITHTWGMAMFLIALVFDFFLHHY